MNPNVMLAQLDTLRVWADHWHREYAVSGKTDDLQTGRAMDAAARQLAKQLGIKEAREQDAEPPPPRLVEEARAD